jgi:sensor c-di-GMP phosphodiesterase-like protein
MTIVAEGIERPEQLDYLVSRGVHLFQGYLFSAPLTLRALVAFVRSRVVSGGAGNAGSEERAGVGTE